MSKNKIPLVKVGEKMVEFLPLKNLEELKSVKTTEMIGVGQLIGDTIPARCWNNDGTEIRLIGNMDDKVIVKYNFKIKNVEGFYEDGSIRTKLINTEYIEKNNKAYNLFMDFWKQVNNKGKIKK